MWWAPNSINVYKCYVQFAIGHEVSTITAHCVPTAGMIGSDNSMGAAQWLAATYGQVAVQNCYVFAGLVNCYAEPCLVRINGTPKALISPGPAVPGQNFTCPEAAFLMRRVGAGSRGLVAGRARFGPLPLTYFSDPPRYRKIDITNGNIISALTLMRNQQMTNPTGYIDVLYNRTTCEAVEVGSYFVPTRTGRVWQRAGFHQGVRGPDRGGHGYGKKRNY